MFKRFLNHRLSIKLCLLIPLLSLSYSSFSQTKKSAKDQENRFKYIEVKSQFGSFLKANSSLRENGLLENGYGGMLTKMGWQPVDTRSEEHTSELQSRGHLVCRLLLEKKNKKNTIK